MNPGAPCTVYVPLVRHVYLHVPFCRRRCSYCDFQIAVRRQVPARVFARDLIAERDLRGIRPPGPLATLYLGGGTPSLLPPDVLAELLDAFPRDADTEVTLEANPEDVNAMLERTPHTVLEVLRRLAFRLLAGGRINGDR